MSQLVATITELHDEAKLHLDVYEMTIRNANYKSNRYKPATHGCSALNRISSTVRFKTGTLYTMETGLMDIVYGYANSKFKAPKNRT